MKHSSNTKKPAAQPPSPPTAAIRHSPMRWAAIALGMLLAAGATWGFMEFVVWNKLPSELVGNWEVVQGPPEYNEAVFEFHRSGKMIGHLNDNGNLRLINAEVRVEEDKLYITTRHPRTGEEHVSVQIIRKLSAREFVVGDERGAVIRMARVP